MQLFEIHFSLWTQQLQQRFPQVTRSLLSRVPSGVLASGALCFASEYVRDGRVASGAPHGSSLARFGSVSSWPESIGDIAALARSVSSGTCPITLPTILYLIFLSQSVKSGASFLHFSPKLGPVYLRDPSQSSES